MGKSSPCEELVILMLVMIFTRINGEVYCYHCGVQNQRSCPFKSESFSYSNVSVCQGEYCVLAVSKNNLYKAWCMNQSSTIFEWPEEFIGTICFCPEHYCNPASYLRKLSHNRLMTLTDHPNLIKWRTSRLKRIGISKTTHPRHAFNHNRSTNDVRHHVMHRYHHRHRRRPLYSAEYCSTFISRPIVFMTMVLKRLGNIFEFTYYVMRMLEYLLIVFPDYIIAGFISLLIILNGKIGEIT